MSEGSLFCLLVEFDVRFEEIVYLGVVDDDDDVGGVDEGCARV